MRARLLALCLFLSLVITVMFIPNIAFATDADGEMVTVEPKAKVIEAGTDLPGQNELLMTYLEKQAAKASAGKSQAKRGVKKTNLKGNDLVIYNYLKGEIEKIAAGNRDNAVISVPMTEILGDKLWFTADDLGVYEIMIDDELDPEAEALFNDMISYDDTLIVNTLLKDLPYELYWFDKTKGVGSSTAEYGYDSEGIGFDDDAALEFTFCVSKDYSASGDAGTAEVDTDKTCTAAYAANYAAVIVEENAELSDLEKVTAYKDKICELTDYNQDAADTDPDYGDPWQLIWVFDNDPATTVVCEGYAKAYQFLCDLSKFKSNLTESRLVYGTMAAADGSEDHMWNIMEMDDNNNYLVDVTNCDEGTIGADDLLFLKGCYDGDIESGYLFDVDGDDTADVSFVYDEEMNDLYTDSQLNLSYWDYEPNNVHQHIMCWYEANEPTCQDEGNIEYWYCYDCERYYKDEEGTIEIGEDDWVLPQGPHDLMHVDAKEPTVEDGGWKEYWYCDYCEQYFLTEEADEAVDYWEDIYLEPTYDYPWDVPGAPLVKKVQSGGDLTLFAEIIDEYGYYDTEDFAYAWYQDPENQGMETFCEDDYYLELEDVTEPQDWYCDVKLIGDTEFKTIHYKVTTLDWYIYVDDSEVYFTKEDIENGNTATLTVKVKGLKEGEVPAFAWEKKALGDEEFQAIACNEATYQAPAKVAEYKVTVTVGDDSMEEYLYVKVDSNLQVTNDYEETVLVDLEEDSATLAIDASNDFGDNTIHYKWYKDGTYLDGETGATLQTGPVTEFHGFSCYIYDDYGNGTTRYFNVSVQNGFTAKAEKSQFEVEPGADVDLHVIAEADQEEPLTYEWYVDGELQNGATTDTLTIEGVAEQTDACCYVTDKYGMSKYVSFSICIDNQFEAEAEQESFVVEKGESVELSVNASVARGDISYSWSKYVYDPDEDEWDPVSLPDTGANLTTDPITAKTEYVCYVSDDYGSSYYVYFYVRPDSGLELIGDSCDEIFVSPGATKELSIEANINEGEPITYSWSKGWTDENNIWRTKPINGANEATLTTEALNKTMEFTGTATDQYGYSVSKTFEINIDTGLHVDRYADDVLVAPGGTAVLHADATANEGVILSYQWFTDGEDDWEKLEGETGDTLTVTDVQGYASYRCLVTDNYGNRQNAYRDVRIDTGFEAESNGSDFYVSPGDDQELRVDVTSNVPEMVSYTWKRYDEDEEEYVEVQPTDPNKPGVLIVENIQQYQKYRCYVDDGYGYSDYFTFWIYIETNLDLEYENEITVAAGQDATLTVTPTSSVADNEYTYEWYDDDYELIDGADTNTYVVTNVQKAMDYRCYVTDKYGNERSAHFEISVENGFEIAYEEKVTIQPGETATLEITVTADSLEGLTYRWYEDEDVLGTDATLEVSRSGWYECRVTDKYGNRKWAEIRVIVDNELSLSIDQLEGVSGYEISIQPGEEITLSATATAKDTSNLKYYWYDNEEDEEYETNSITVTPERSGTYECSVQDQYGNWAEAYVRVKVDSGFSAVADGETDFIVNYGDSVTAKVAATTSEGTLSYRWYIDDDEDSEEIVAARDQDECTFVPEKTGGFYCRVSDGFNTEYIDFYVRIDTGLSLAYNETVNAEEGVPVTLEVNVTGGAGTISYQWYEKYIDEDGDIWYDWIDNANKSTYTVKKPENTTYRCEVSDGVDTQYAVIEVVVKACEHEGMTHTPAVAATCTKAGNIEYWYCGDCGKYFSDANAETQISKADTVEKAKGHKWSEPKYEWADDYSKVTATKACTNNTEASCKITETVGTTSEETVKAKCETKGEITYTAEFTKSVFAKQTKTKETPALGHDYKEVAGSAVAATCEKAGKEADQQCSKCGNVKTGKTITALGHDWDEGKVTTEPGCETTGVKTFTCKRDATHTTTETIAAIGHDWGGWEVATPSTCVLEGQEVRTCKHDPSHKEYREAALLAHQLTHVDGTPATCEAGGSKEYWTCSACRGIFSDAEGKTQITEADLPIAALGHAYGDWTPVDENQHQRVCANDPKHIETAAHVWDEGVVTKEASTTETGEKTFTCSLCGQTRIEVIPMLDKDLITPSDAAADQAPVDKTIPKVNAARIKTTANIGKKQMTVKFPVNAAVDNYRIQYRLAGKAAWKNAWSAGKSSYIIKGLKRYSCCEFRIAGYVKQEDGSWARGAWSKSAYRYMNTVGPKAPKSTEKGQVTVTWAKDKKATGYEIQYSLKSNMKGAKTVPVAGKNTTKYTIKAGLKSGKKYYIKVRPIKKVSGKSYIGSLSSAKSVKVK